MCQNVITIFGCCKYPDSTHISTESLPYMRLTGTPETLLWFPSFLSSCFPQLFGEALLSHLSFEAYIMVIQSTFLAASERAVFANHARVWFFTGSQNFQGQESWESTWFILFFQGVGSWVILWLKLRASGKGCSKGWGRNSGVLHPDIFQSLNFRAKWLVSGSLINMK